MGKISQIAAKYIIHAQFNIEGVVDKPDIIGAVFGQTEGLLGNDLELRELQRNGRIGRIEVESEVHSGKTKGVILIPSSLDKAETCIIGAALEIIQRIGPCNSKITVNKIEDVRISKRNQVIGRAKDLLRNLMDTVMPDSKEIADEVAYSVRVMEIVEYGKDALPAGPTVDESDEVILVEGRADVLNLLKHGFKNVIAMNGTSVPQTIIDLSKEKVLTVFVDGDRGGNLILRELSAVAEIDFVTSAPDGKEVEEITKKEINKAIRSKIAFEQAKFDLKKDISPNSNTRKNFNNSRKNNNNNNKRSTVNNKKSYPKQQNRSQSPQIRISAEEKKAFKEISDELVGTRGASILDEKMNVLGKVPVRELESTIKSLKEGIYAVVFDGEVDKNIASAAESAGVKIVIGMDSKIGSGDTKVSIMTSADF